MDRWEKKEERQKREGGEGGGREGLATSLLA